jgi:hypothetical protein
VGRAFFIPFIMTVLSTQTGHFRDALLDLANALALIEGGGDIAAPRMERIQGVKVKIDEMMPEGEGSQFSVEDDTNNTNILDLYINSRLDPAAKILMQIAPIHVIIGIDAIDTNLDEPAIPVRSEDNLTGYVILPDDYIRLIAFKMDGWYREVTELFKHGDSKYNKQYTVLRGGKNKPACNITQKVIGATVKKIIEYFSLDALDDHIIEKFIYVGEIAAEDVQANLTDALEWICAKNILQITGRPKEDIDMAEENIQTCFINLK